MAAYEEAIAILRSLDAPLKLAHTVRHLGDIHRHAGDLELAKRCYDEALGLYGEHPEAPALDVANALRAAALLAETLGDRPQALQHWQAAKGRYEEANVTAGAEEAARRVSRLR